ncbi:MAG: hypothetical protein ABL308_12115 [Oceanicaulis sp.]
MKHLAIAAAVSVFAAGCVQAQSVERTTFDGIVGTHNLDTDGDVEMNGVAVTLRGRVGGNVEMNGASVDMRADVAGDVEANGGSAELNGEIGGRTEVNAGSARLMGSYAGPVEVAAGAAELRGAFANALEIDAGRINFRGEANGPIRFHGQGERHGWRDRGDDSEIRIRGALNAGGRICAHEVRFESGAVIGGPLEVVADSPPEFAVGVDQSRITFVQRDGRCD